MSGRISPLLAAIAACAAPVLAEAPMFMDEPTSPPPAAPPVKLTFQPAPQSAEPSVYALPSEVEGEAGNTGGVGINFRVNYFTDHMYRGVNIPDFVANRFGEDSSGQANFQFDGRLTFDLGRLPHPFIGVFANVLDSDPVTNFEEVRPFFGAEWSIRPLIIEVGNNTYLFPDRSILNTAEAYAKITLDDAAILRREERFLSPYILAAYDYDEYKGWYFETGVSHTFVIEDTPITITVVGDVAYVMDHGAFAGPTGEDTGLHHWEVGAIGRYNLNTLLNIPQRLGKWSLNGYLFYVDGIDDQLRSDTTLFGGAGIELQY